MMKTYRYKLMRARSKKEVRTCRFCGYVGSDWGHDDECPACGEVN